MEKVSDLSRLVKKAQKNPQAFAQLYAQTFSFSYSVAKRYLNNPQDIEDVLQTSYMYAAKSLSSLRDPEHFCSWMQTIIMHECQKCLRNNKKISDLILRSKETVALEDEQSMWTDYIEQNETYDTVRKIVDSLPNEQKMCAALFYYEEMSVEEIAAFLKVPQGTVKSRLFHVRKKVEKALRKLSKEDGALFGAAPFPALRSYFKHSEREVAAASLRENVWAAILSPGSVSRGAGHFLRFGAAASGSAGIAASSGTATSVAIKATAIAVSAVAVVGGSMAAREHIRSAPLPATETTTTTTATDYSVNETSQSAESETTAANEPVGTRPTTASESHEQQTQTNTSAVSLRKDSTTPVSFTTKHGAAQTTTQKATSAVRMSGASSNTSAAAKTTTITQPAAVTTRPTSTTAATATTRSTTTAAVTSTSTAVSSYQMSGGVLQSYSGSESSVSIPATIDGQAVTAIGSGAFARNDSLRSVQIPSSVTQIGQQAFSDCASLQVVQMPSSLSSIGAGAFDGCTSLSSVSIPSRTTSIGDDAFYGCVSLRSITIPPSVQSIGDGAFDGCDDLTIQCAENSAAHTYAETHGIPYQLSGGI